MSTNLTASAPTIPPTTSDREYAERLIRAQSKAWKRVLDVQAPYRWNLRRLRPGYTLEIGCGIGRNLLHLGRNGVGLDHNPYSIAYARERGLDAYTPDAFRGSPHDRPATFDALLFSHVLEHMTEAEAVDLITTYLPWLRPGGRVLMICPQEVGYRSDPTHVEFMDFAKLRRILKRTGLSEERAFSFPFPRPVGRVFIYNEFVVIGRQGQEKTK